MAVPPDKAIPPVLFSNLASPIDALLSGRISRGEQTMANAVLLNRQDNIVSFKLAEGRARFQKAPQLFALLRSTGLQSYLNFDIVSVGASCNNDNQVRPVPMNWWLSMPTQANLDGELCAPHNRSTIAGVLSQLGPQPGDDDAAALRARYQDGVSRVAKACPGTRVMRSRQVR